MAKKGHRYPQVEARASDLMDPRVADVTASASVARALEAALAADVRIVAHAGAAARRDDLSRAVAWGLSRRRWLEIGTPGLPSVTAGADEIAVRRLFHAGAGMALVRDGRKVVGVVERPVQPASSVASRLERVTGVDEARLWLLRTAGKLGEAQGHAVHAVGGFVRDLLLARARVPAGSPDLDLVVEGDGIAFGRSLAEETGGQLVVHAAFGSASLEGGTTPDGTRLGRVDIATARRERYVMPGALPEVTPAGIEEDLGRRDFSVNAMSIALSPSAWGRLLDPHAGRRDLEARRLRILHPLAFVEDPTRIFRAARYAARLGLEPDAAFMRALDLACRAGRYPALSGQRLHAELELVMSEAEPWKALGLLLGWGALKIWDPGYRLARKSRGRLHAARRFAAWARRAGVAYDAGLLALAALLFDQSRPTAERCLRRLAVAGAQATQIDTAGARALARRAAARALRRPSQVAETLRPAGEALLVAAWLCGGRRTRGRIEWFLALGRGARPLSSGDEVVAAGVPRGPRVAQALGALRDLRLDGRVRTKDDERAALGEWFRAMTRKGESR